MNLLRVSSLAAVSQSALAVSRPLILRRGGRAVVGQRCRPDQKPHSRSNLCSSAPQHMWWCLTMPSPQPITPHKPYTRTSSRLAASSAVLVLRCSHLLVFPYAGVLGAALFRPCKRVGPVGCGLLPNPERHANGPVPCTDTRRHRFAELSFCRDSVSCKSGINDGSATPGGGKRGKTVCS